MAGRFCCRFVEAYDEYCYRIRPREMSYRILVADDEELLHDLLARSLDASKYAISSVYDGLEVKQMALRDKPDLILLDIHLPGRDGREVLLDLRSDPDTRSIPVLVLTADKGEILGEAEGFELGADEYVQKPFSPAVLQARIEKLLRKSGE